MDIIQLISAAGIGSIIGSVITTIIHSWLSNRSKLEDRKYSEKKSAYIGFLQSILQSEVMPTKENSLHVGYWINICEIAGSDEVKFLLEEFGRTNPVNEQIHSERPEIMKKIKRAMKEDLGLL
jgi:hypothetical protein